MPCVVLMIPAIPAIILPGSEIYIGKFRRSLSPTFIVVMLPQKFTINNQFLAGERLSTKQQVWNPYRIEQFRSDCYVNNDRQGNYISTHDWE